MSIHLTTGYEFETQEALSAAKLNAMLDDSRASGMVSSDLATNYRLLDIATSQPTATLGYPWIDESGQLRFGDGSFFQYGSGILQLTYSGGGTITRGTIVSFAHAADRSVVKSGSEEGNNNDARAMGVLLDASLSSGSAGFFMYRGLCLVAVASAVTSGPYANIPLAGSHIYAFGLLFPGKAYVQAPPSAAEEPFALLGIFNDTATGASFADGLYICKVWK